MTKFKKPLLFVLCLLPVAIIAGVFVGFYQLDTYSEEIIAEVVAQLGSTDALIAVGAVQTVGYALFCGFFGYILADKTGLWKPVRFEKRGLTAVLVTSAVAGIVLSLDHWTVGSAVEGIQTANVASLSVNGFIASVLYGGIIEEVMLRLFFVSLIAFVLRKLFFKKQDGENLPSIVFTIANVIAALLFAAGHLPATVSIFGGLTPMLLLRCFLLNGGFGLVFGLLYRRYGIVYAMAAHAGSHIVSKMIWILFI